MGKKKNGRSSKKKMGKTKGSQPAAQTPQTTAATTFQTQYDTSPAIWRFSVGTRVACNLNGEWPHGTVVKLNYEENGRSHPYQIRLDLGESMIFASTDTDCCIQRSIPKFDPLATIEDVDEEDEEVKPNSVDTVGSIELRFKVGDRVECCMGCMSPGEWLPGTIVSLRFDAGIFIVPYNVLLDMGENTNVPKDWETVIRRTDVPFPKHLLIDDKDPLFSFHPGKEECPICCLPFAPEIGSRVLQPCCGRTICNGCFYEMAKKSKSGTQPCPFCRAVFTHGPEEAGDREIIRKLRRRCDVGDTSALQMLGDYYSSGSRGLEVDCNKAFELWTRAYELGDTQASGNLGVAYSSGIGVERDCSKAAHFFSIAAMAGDVVSRASLGGIEQEQSSGNIWKAYRHFLISASCGYEGALDAVMFGFRRGFITKQEYADGLKAYQEARSLMKSAQRDRAFAFDTYEKKAMICKQNDGRLRCMW